MSFNTDPLKQAQEIIFSSEITKTNLPTLSITHEIYHSLDDSLEVRGAFLDISKTYDKVWHNGLILKLH